MNSQFNEYVITQICSHLSVADLKIVRSLNSIWNMGSTPILRKNGCKLLNLDADLDSIINTESFNKNHFPCQAIRISSKSSSSQNAISNMYPEFSEYFYKNNNLPSSVTLLDLRLTICTEVDIPLVNDILEYYSPTIQTLYLDLKNTSYKSFILRQSLNFPKLEIYFDTALYRDEFYKQLFEAAPNLTLITFSEMYRGAGGLEVLVKNPQMLPKFSQLCVQKVSFADLQYLANWPRKLKLLAIKRFSYTSNKIYLYEALQRLLENQAESLNKLYLKDLPSLVPNVESEFTLKYPPCPNIVKLILEFDKYGFKFVFGDNGDINYERDFPKLRKLSISSKYESWVLIPVYNSFFPKDDKQICKSLMSLSLQKSSKEFVINFEERLEKLFPNARITFQV